MLLLTGYSSAGITRRVLLGIVSLDYAETMPHFYSSNQLGLIKKTTRLSRTKFVRIKFGDDQTFDPLSYRRIN